MFSLQQGEKSQNVLYFLKDSFPKYASRYHELGMNLYHKPQFALYIHVMYISIYHYLAEGNPNLNYGFWNVLLMIKT